MFNKILSVVIWCIAMLFILFEVAYFVSKSNTVLTLAISAGTIYIILTCILVFREMVEWYIYIYTDMFNVSVSF